MDSRNEIETEIVNNRSSIYTKTIFVWVCALIACFLWGSAFPTIKLGYSEFMIGSSETANQILFAGIRFFLAGIMAVMFGSISNKKLILPKKESVSKIFKLSMLQTVAQYVLFYIGLAHTTGVRASIVEGTNVFVAIIVASLLFKLEKLTVNKILGCVIGFIGVVLVNIKGSANNGGNYILGDFLIMASTVAYAFSSVFLKRYSKEEDPIVLSGYQFIIGGIIMIFAGMLLGGRISHITSTGVGYLLYLAFISAGAYSLWGILMKYNPVSKVAVFGFMTPVFGVITSLIMLDEGSGLRIMHLLSLIFVCAGILIVNLEASERNRNNTNTES